MRFFQDKDYAAEVGGAFGEYLVTYESDGKQVRAYLFRKRDGRVEAHVSFPGRVSPSDVTDPYVTDLWGYARDKNLAEKFQLVMS